MVLARLWPFASREDEAAPLYREIVAQARRPEFYAALGVPDSVDGRFDMIALHMFLVLNRLKSDDAAPPRLAQALFDMMFADMDRSLREMGAGDLGVGRRVQAMAEALYGRIAAYESGMAADDATLAAALRRNLYGTVADPGPSAAILAVICGYLREAAQALAGQEVGRLNEGDVRFPEIPAVR